MQQKEFYKSMNTKQSTELLSPAGDIEAGYAALFYGADAVYLGLPRFSARAEAINFTESELDGFVAYAHSIGRKVYVALNTLVQEHELPAVMVSLGICVRTRVDGVIVQDLGIARLIRLAFPELILHASTQMAIHNLEGALALKKLGFTRVVLARELSLPEIQKIQKESGLEIEVFIHGALCYSYSGLCSFSSFSTARSANRGKCVYSCRDTFKMDGHQSHLFSMKDMALEKEVLRLPNISLKIEGRKKNALYVAAVTDYYRRILDTGNADISLSDNVKQIFARPWTKLHFNGKNKDVIDPDFVGHRGLKIGTVQKLFDHAITVKPSMPIARYDGIQIDIEGGEKPFGFSAESLVQSGRRVFEACAGKEVEITLPPHHPFVQKGADVYLASSTRVKGSYDYTKPKPGAFKNRTLLDVSVFITADKIVACAADKSAETQGPFTPAKDLEKMQAALRGAFEKTGDTVFELNDLTVENNASLFVPMSILNELRRSLYEQLEVTFEARVEPKLPALKPNANAPKWIVKTDNVGCLADIPLNECDEIWVVVDVDFNIKTLDRLPLKKVRLCLPPITRATDKISALVGTLWQAGFHAWAIGNLSGLTFLPAEANIVFDTFISIMNSQAIGSAAELGATGITLSPEDTSDNMQKLAKIYPHTHVVLYQDTPLFLSANCVRSSDCAECSAEEEHTEISNGKGQFELISKNCQTTVISTAPLCIANEKNQIAAAAYRVDFCYKTYTAGSAATIWHTVRGGNDVRGSQKANAKKQFA